MSKSLKQNFNLIFILVILGVGIFNISSVAASCPSYQTPHCQTGQIIVPPVLDPVTGCYGPATCATTCSGADETSCSLWGTCSGGIQTCTGTFTKTPAGCAGGSVSAPTRYCSSPVSCSGATCTSWGTCTNNTQTCTEYSLTPSGCSGSVSAPTQSPCAATYSSSFYRVRPTDVTGVVISEWGTCRIVSSDKDILVPTKTSNEWSQFLTNASKLSYVRLQACGGTGGSISSSGGYTTHTFTVSGGTFGVVGKITGADVLICAGGGSGGGNEPGGAGAGGCITKTDLTIDSGNYPVTVGAGASGNGGLNGNNTSFLGLTAIGGGGGGAYGGNGCPRGRSCYGGGGAWYYYHCGSGGSGGGGEATYSGCSGTSGQGNSGGSNYGGGGGAGGAGSSNRGGGGAGITWVDGNVYGVGGPGNGSAGSGAPGSGGGWATGGQNGIVKIRYKN